MSDQFRLEMECQIIEGIDRLKNCGEYSEDFAEEYDGVRSMVDAASITCEEADNAMRAIVQEVLCA
jgi:hypothetical protein